MRELAPPVSLTEHRKFGEPKGEQRSKAICVHLVEVPSAEKALGLRWPTGKR
jgi:hypothetical protein